MTRPGIEPSSAGPLANTLPIDLFLIWLFHSFYCLFPLFFMSMTYFSVIIIIIIIQIIKVPPLSILRMVQAILQVELHKCLSIQWDFYCRSWFWEVFLFVLFSFFFFFLSSLLVWWGLLPITPSTCNFPFLQAFCPFLDLAVPFLLLFVFFHFSLWAWHIFLWLLLSLLFK